MSDHPTLEKMLALSRDQLAKPESGRVHEHLRRCPPCRLALAQVALNASEPLAEGALEPVCAADYGAAFDRALAAVRRQKLRHDRQCRRVERHLPAVRAARTREELANTGLSRIEGCAPIEALLQCSHEARHSDPPRMVMYAEQARIWVEMLDRERHGHLAVADLQARVWAELGNAYRVCDRLREADLALTTAQQRFAWGSRPPVLKARILDVLASLRVAQRRFETAHSLLDRVHSLYKRAGDLHMAGRALISKGLYATYEQRPAEALDLLTRGRVLIDPARDPKLALSAVHDSIWLLVDLGEHRKARRELFAHRHLYLADGDAMNLVRLSWLEGRIAAGAGNLEQAARLFQQVRERLGEMNLPYTAAIAGLDLAAVLLQQDRLESVFSLVEEMAVTFRSLRIGREALAALLVLRDACERERVTLDVIQTVAAFLRTVERDPTACFGAGQPAAN